MDFTNQPSRIAHLWNTNREALYSSGSEIMAAVSENARVSGEPGKSLFNRAYGIFRETYDPAYGGFRRAPKFPSSHNLMFLMDYSCLENSQSAMDMAENTLKNMYRGGIFDHIGGGFSRYSTDEKWLVPHFEKMLYDNALLIMSVYPPRSKSQKILFMRILSAALPTIFSGNSHLLTGDFTPGRTQTATGSREIYSPAVPWRCSIRTGRR